jgi:hypothetical protein
MSDKNDDVEGLGSDEDASWKDYPIDTMLIRHETRTVHETLRRMEKGFFVMDPDFQRDFIWPEDKQSKLIESVLMRIPLPVFYLAENRDGKMVVVDGLQRLSTFQRFVRNELYLKLPKQGELDGKTFNDLSPKLQNRVEDCVLIQYIVDSKVPPRALLDIFDRVNSGIPLNKQQMRNCVYMGEATKFLKREAASELFKKATGDSLRADIMRDREMVNRFCAFQLLGVKEYRGDMEDFLGRTLEVMNNLGPSAIDTLSSELRRGLINNLTVFGRHAFRKFAPEHDTRSVFNASLWDVMSTGLSKLSEPIVEAKRETIRNGLLALMQNSTFHDSITLGTSQVNRVKDRFNAVKSLFEEITNA